MPPARPAAREASLLAGQSRQLAGLVHARFRGRDDGIQLCGG
jgi:hypothetical protein